MTLKNKQAGFTLIELLVVIAIIGILASVVLASLSSARNKGLDGKISSQLSSMRAQAQLYSGTGTAFAAAACATTAGSLFETTNNGLGNLLTGLTLSNTGCVSNGTLPTNGGTWAVSAKLSTGAWACVDYTGSSRTTTSTSLTAAYVAGGATAPIDSTTMTCTNL